MISYGVKPNWTPEEKAYLEENWGRISIGTIAKNLGRSENAILIKACRFGLGPYLESGEYITLNQLLIALKGHTPNTMANYISRSAQAISGKIERLIKEGHLFPRNEFRVSC